MRAISTGFLALAHGASSATEYLAVMPNAAGPAAGSDFKLQWLKLDYPVGGPSSTSDVSMKLLTETVPELGSWYNLDIGEGAMLSAKVLGDSLYMYANRGVAPTGGGCCADTIRVYSKSDGSSKEIDLEAPLQKAIPNGTLSFPPSPSPSGYFVHATHTFDISSIDGVPHAFVMVQYSETALGNAHTDAIAVVNMNDGTLRPTADGDAFFNILEKAGTTEDTEDASRFKIQFQKTYTDEQWHGNGMNRFTTKSGVTILAFTHRFAAEAVLLKDPWTYKAANGGGKILQRFGCPTQYANGAATQNRRAFGVDTTNGPSKAGVHNVFYQVKANGTETVSMFANGVGSDSYSHVFEFEVNLADEAQKATSDDVFTTAWSTAAFTFSSQSQGGARALGNGVWIGASGGAQFGYQIVDKDAKTQSYSYTDAQLYDPFCRVVASSGDSVLVV